MKLFELIEYIDANAIRVEAQHGKLSITADDALLGAEVESALRQFKKEVAAYYADEPAMAHAPEPVRAYQLSFAQQRLYFLYQYDRAARHFNIPVELTIDGPLEVESFLRAFEQMMLQHPIHQTTYTIVDGVPMQRYEPWRRCECTYFDISLPPEGVQELLTAARKRFAQTRFDLETQLPYRAQLLRTGNQTYVLLLVFHHIATDEWSLMRLIEDLAQAYRARRGDTPLTRHSGVTYFDFVKWQHGRFESGFYEVARSYWKDHLADAPRVLELPRDRPRPGEQTYEGSLVSRELPASLRGKVSATARRLESTEFAVYLAVYYLLLQRLTGQRDLVVGIDVFGRDSLEFKEVAGFFVNQLALRTQVPVEGSRGEYFKRVTRMAARSLAFQEMPFEKVVDALQIEREIAYSPVFQVKFLFHGNTLDLSPFDGLRVESRNIFEPQSQYDATLQVLRHEVRLHYNSDLFFESTVRGWLDTYFAILEECLADTERSVHDLLQSRLQEQLAPLTQGCNQVVPDNAIFARIQQAICERPRQLAVFAQGCQISYAELGARLGATAAHLQAIGIQHGDKVGVYLEPSIEMAVAVIAIMSVGAVLVPLDTGYPAERINEILADSGVGAVVTDATLTDHLGDYCGVRLDINRLQSASSEGSQWSAAAVDPSAPAYLLYTSGSTGRPKGVLVRHDSFANLCDWYIDFAQIDAASRVLLMIPIGFDASLKNIVAPLMSGATLVMSPPAVFDPDALLGLIDTSGVTTINCAPSALYALLHADEPGAYRSLRNVRMLAVGGEALQLELVKPWLRSPQCHCVLANIYGPTECTDIAVAYKAHRAEWLMRERVVIGRPIQNTQAFIVDECLRQCPPGVSGELIIAGRGVAMGYHRWAEASTPFVRCDLSATTVYRSGDICRYDGDGEIVYLGRRDGQVKIRGKRVETDEVLAHLARLLPGRALSVQRYANANIETLVAFVEGDAPSGSFAAIREGLIRYLPRHAVPSQILFLSKLPLNANGKVSGPALLEWYEAERGRIADTPVRQLTETESVIASVWSRLLRVTVNDPQTDFFSIGGDSIFSIQLVAELHKHGFAVTVADVFKCPSIEQLAGLCERRALSHVPAPTQRSIAPFVQVPPADRADLPADLEDAYPLTSLQLGMLFHHDMERSSAVYHDVFAYDLEFEYDALVFSDAIRRVVDRHPVLRTGFDLRSYSIPLQLVHRQVSSQIVETDISLLPEPQQDEAVRAALERSKRASFDVSTPSLIRFTLLKRHDRRIHFIVAAHHVILDGWSMATLKRQIFEQYLHQTRGTPLSRVFDSGDLRFADYVASQACDAADAKSQAFWKAYCSSCSSGAIAGLPELAGDARCVAVNVEPSLVHRLAALSRREGIGLKTLLLLAHMQMLRSFMSDEQLTTVLTDNGRPEAPGSENVAGLFLNVLPFRTSFAQQTWRQVAEAAHADDVNRKPHRRLPFARIVQSHRALQIDSLFTYNNFHVAAELKKSDALTVLAMEDFSFSNFKLATLAYGNFESSIGVRLTVRIDLSHREMQALLEEFMSALRHMAAGYDAPIPQRRSRPLPCFESGLDGSVHRYSHLRYRGSFDGQTLQTAAVLLNLGHRSQGGLLSRVPEEQVLWLGTTAAIQSPREPFAGANADAVIQVVHREEGGWQQLAFRYSASKWDGADAEALAGALLAYYIAAAQEVSELEVRLDGRWYPTEQAMRDAEYWAVQCPDTVERLDLRLDHSRRIDVGAPLRQQAVHLGPELCVRLHEVASQCGVSRVAVHLGAWLVLLGRLSRQHTIVTRVSGYETDLPKSFPLRLELADDPNVVQVLKRVDAALTAAARHRYIPMRVLQNRLQTRVLSPNAQARVGADAQHVELALHLSENPSSVVGNLSYDSGIFDAGFARRFAAHFANLLAAIASDVTSPVHHLEFLSRAERHELLVGWNDTRQAFSPDLLIHELFERQVEQRPDAIAVVYAEQQLSYGQLNARANQLAHYLRKQGVRPDRLVALCIERSLEMVIGILATLKAGGAYVPLDPDYPAERLQYLLADSAPAVLLTEGKLRQRVGAAAGCAVVLLDAGPWEECAWGQEPPHNPDARSAGLNNSHLAYVIYTSGSTGTPKGVMVQHSNVVNFVMGLEQRIYQAHPCRNIAWNSSFGFDMSVKAWGQLLMGRSVFLVPEAVRFNPGRLVQFINRHGIEAIECTPSHLRLMLDGGMLTDREGSIRVVLIGGEAIDPASWELLASLARVAFFNMYGPTEATVDACLGRVLGRQANVGVPMPNAQIYILDEHREPMPVGVAGEIFIGGAGVARGYLNRPELTAERFLEDPFSADSGARMYRTGDLGRWDEQGRIEFLGRNDHQVKIRGFRIELGEIEAQLMRMEGVRQAAVIAREDSPGEKRLVAYVVGEQSGAEGVNAAALRGHLSGVLPEYMVPAAYMRLENLPLTANGKVDLRALPAPDGESYVTQRYEAPVGEIETMLGQIWSDVLKVPRVGRHDNFFALGGHSLLAMQLVGRIRRDLQVDISIREIFEYPTLTRMADSVTTQQIALFSDEQVSEASQELEGLSGEELQRLLVDELRQ